MGKYLTFLADLVVSYNHATQLKPGLTMGSKVVADWARRGPMDQGAPGGRGAAFVQSVKGGQAVKTGPDTKWNLMFSFPLYKDFFPALHLRRRETEEICLKYLSHGNGRLRASVGRWNKFEENDRLIAEIPP
jgi:hypothetical protein